MMKKMKKFFAMALSCVMLASLTACGGGQSTDGQEKVVLNVYNWGDYIDPEILDEFTKETGIQVNYEEYATNEEMLAKIQAGTDAYDVIFPSEYMVAYMREHNLLQELNYENIPNQSHLDDRFKNLSYDPNGKYSVPYLWGSLGILYNKTKVTEPVDSWNILWNEKYKGDIVMLDSSRDTIAVALLKLGYSINTQNEEELQKAKEELIKQKLLVRSYEVDNYKNSMASGELAMVVTWAGDAMNLMAENEDLEYALPKEGTNLWFDAIAIPVTSKHKTEAEQFINFMLKPEIAAKNSAYIKYSTTNKDALELLPEEEVTNPNMYPTQPLSELGEVFVDLGEFTEKYDTIWTEIKSY